MPGKQICRQRIVKNKNMVHKIYELGIFEPEDVFNMTSINLFAIPIGQVLSGNKYVSDTNKEALRAMEHLIVFF